MQLQPSEAFLPDLGLVAVDELLEVRREGACLQRAIVPGRRLPTREICKILLNSNSESLAQVGKQLAEVRARGVVAPLLVKGAAVPEQHVGLQRPWASFFSFSRPQKRSLAE